MAFIAGLYGMGGALPAVAGTPTLVTEDFAGSPVSVVRPGPDFDLPDAAGNRHRLADYRGKVVLLYFGFMSCPDVCPTTLARLADAMRRLGEDSARVQVIFITLDPERDRPADAQAYVASFDPRFIALIPPVSELASLARGLGAYYRKVPGRQPGSYTLDHTAGVHAYDRRGQLRLVLGEQQPVTAIAADLRRLLDTP